jgi:FAD/FMN-containing dehydrogenase
MFETLPFQLHFLKKYIHIKLCFDSNNDDHKVLLDKVTSEAIKIGGTVKASRKVLTMISPYLDKRILGNYNMKVHNGLKQTFDPRDVLNPSSFFYLREKSEKSPFQRIMDKNKQINYIFSK